MEEDIEILEEMIKKYRNDNVNILDLDSNDLFKRLILNQEQVQLLENLIKGYRKLEKRNKRQFKLLQKRDKNSIPKSKVKEKIEKLKADIKQKGDYITCGNAERIEVLQELMED